MKIVLVPHPYVEPDLTGEEVFVPWNTGKHRRKFLCGSGRYLANRDGPALQGAFRFWGEYEAPTLARRLPMNGSGMPRYIHTPVDPGQHPARSSPAEASCASPRCCQNTDPWLWDDGFTWTVCRHTARGTHLRRLIREWSEPAIVLFGGVTGGQWLLDTVLVAPAKQGPPQRPAQLKKGEDKPYRRLVLDCLSGMPLLRPIRGAAHGSGTGASMFSFVPAATEPTQGFARPDIAALLQDWLSRDGSPPPALNNARQLTQRSVRPETAEGLWRAVRDEVNKKLVLAVAFDNPPAWDTLL